MYCLLMATECMHLINIGGLERQGRQRGDGEDGAEVTQEQFVKRADMRRRKIASPTTTMSANSAMRTNPASTIGEIGGAAALSAMASARSESGWAFG